MAETGMREIPRVFKGESNCNHLAIESHDVIAAIVLIWEHTGYKASFIVPLRN